jgi:hypothetical protein
VAYVTTDGGVKQLIPGGALRPAKVLHSEFYIRLAAFDHRPANGRGRSAGLCVGLGVADMATGWTACAPLLVRNNGC